MTDYHKIWKSINTESENSSVRTQIAKKIRSESMLPVFLATDFNKGIRLLYIKPDPGHGINIDALPRFNGLEITLSLNSLGGYVNEEFLKFTQSIPNTDNIFELVISDIADSITQLHDKKHLFRTLTKVLNEWKIFFEKKENQIMSLSEQQGLIGELSFLKNYLFKKYSFTESLIYWTGADRTNHDFQIENIAVEVKTTSGKRHKKFTVSSERQLDNTGIEHLYLGLYSLNLHHNQPSANLPSLVREIRETIQSDPSAVFQFESRLAKCGYSEKESDKYTCGFSISEFRVFEVREGFPRLLGEDLPAGIGDLKYTVTEAACISFEIKTDILKII